jgi:hypothetical protein
MATTPTPAPTTPPTIDQCDGCRFVRVENGKFVCRRYPPSFSNFHWPLVLATDWCGEFLK